MTDVNDSHSSTSTSSGKENSAKNSSKATPTQKIKNLESEINKLNKKLLVQDEALAAGLDGVFGWQLPGTDAYAIKYWALMFEMTVDVFCEWVKKYRVPYIGGNLKKSFVRTTAVMEYMQQTHGENDGEETRQKE